MKQGLVVVLAAAALAALPGCGGGAEGDSTSPAEAKFIASTNSICREDISTIRTIFSPTRGASMASYLDQLEPLLDAHVAKLKELEPPASQRSAYDAWIADLERELDGVKRAQEAARVGRSGAAGDVLQSELKLDARATAKARALGLDACVFNRSGKGGPFS